RPGRDARRRARVREDDLRAAAGTLRGGHGSALRGRLPEPLRPALRGAAPGAAGRDAGGPDRARALARAGRRSRARRPRPRGPRRGTSPGHAGGLLPPAHPHRDGEGAARARVPRARGAGERAAAVARRPRDPGCDRARTPGRVSRPPDRGAYARLVAIPARRDRWRLAAGEDDQAVGRRVRVVFLVTRFPVPPWRGDQVRAYHHLRLLAPSHEITCVALVVRPPPWAARAELEAMGVRVAVVRLGLAGAIPSLGRALRGDPRPLQVLLYARRRARA